MKFSLKYISLTEKKKKIFANLSWAVIGKVIDILRSLLIGVLIARYLKPYNYGLLNYTIGYVGMFTLFVEFGMTQILSREFSKKSANINELMGSATIFRTLVSTITIGIIITSVIFFEEDPLLKLFIIINAFNLVGYSHSETLRAFFRSQLKNEYIVKSMIFRTITLSSLQLVLLILKAPLIAFVISYSFESLLIMLTFYYFFRKKYWSQRNFKFNKVVLKTLILSSIPLFVDGVASIFYQKIDVVMAGKFIGAESVGYYSAALKFVAFALFIPLVITQTLNPLLVQKFEEFNNNPFNKEYLAYKQKVADIIIFSGTIISITLFFLAKPLILILYGNDYAQAVDILRVLSWKGIFCSLGYAASILIITEGRQKYFYLSNIVGGILNLSLNFLLIPRLGLIGVAFAAMISFCIATFVCNMFIPLYRVDFKTQSNSLFFSWLRLYRYIKEIGHKK